MRTTAIFFSLLLLLSTQGCSYLPGVKQKIATVSIEKLQELIRTGGAKIDEVIAALEAVEANPGESEALKAFGEKLDQLDQLAMRVRDRRAAIKARMSDHIHKWNDELSSIQSGAVQNAFESRKEKLVSTLQSLGASMDALKEKFRPFLAKLKEIRSQLSNGEYDAVKVKIGEVKAMLTALKAQGAKTEQAMTNAIASFVGK